MHCQRAQGVLPGPVAALALLVIFAGCDGPQQASWRRTASTSIALTPAGDALWVASPDDDRVVRIDPETLEQVAFVAVEGGPSHVAIGPDGRVLASRSLGASVAVLDGAAVRDVPVPCGGPGAVIWPGETAFVACPHDDRVVEFDPDGGVVRVLRVGPRPAALATQPGWLAVAIHGGRRAYAIATVDGLPTSAEPQTIRGRLDDFAPTAGFAATRVRAVAPLGTGFVTAFQRVDHDSDRDRPPEQGTYGQLFDDAPRIEPMLHGACAPRYARFDGGRRVFSGPTAVAAAEAGPLWVVNQFTDNVAALDCGASGELAPLTAAFGVGRGPRGVAVSADGRTAWIDVAFDHAVARLDLPDAPDDGVLEAAATRRRETGPLRYDARALQGRQLFHDAVDTHLTPSGVVTCATCHPDGGEDGLSWFLHTPTVARKLRRTPAAYGARTALAPFHWDGEFAAAAELVRGTITGLMDGDALLIDVDAVAAWMDALPAPPGRPAFDADDAALIARGEAVFDEAGCAECHPAPLYADGRSHSVVAASADPDGVLEVVDTPTLLGVRGRAPYLHDGRVADLPAAIRAHEGSAVTDMAALVRYLESR